MAKLYVEDAACCLRLLIVFRLTVPANGISLVSIFNASLTSVQVFDHWATMSGSPLDKGSKLLVLPLPFLLQKLILVLARQSLPRVSSLTSSALCTRANCSDSAVRKRKGLKPEIPGLDNCELIFAAVVPC